MAGPEHRPDARTRGPLHGIRVVEVGVWHAGPGAGAILADLGADVIKIEGPAGDPERTQGSFGPMDRAVVDIPNWTTLFEFSNRNKRSVEFDVGTESGYRQMEALVGTADVFLTNLRKSTRSKLKIDYDSITTIKSDIVYVGVSGFGVEGPLQNMGGFDPLGQAISGMMFLSGRDEPSVMQIIVLDQLTAITASHAAVTALLARERDGHGQETHVSLYGSAIWLTHMNLLAASIMQGEFDTSWDRTENPPLRTTYMCADAGWIMGTNHPEEKYWPNFCAAIGAPGLEHDPRFATKDARSAANKQLIELLDGIFATKPRDEWMRILTSAGVLFAPVNTIADVLEDEQAAANGYIVDFDHRRLGTIKIPGFPVSFSAQEVGTWLEAPEQGEHTEEVLNELAEHDASASALR